MKRISRHLSMKLSLGILLMAAPTFVLVLGIVFLQSRYLIRQNASERANSTLTTTLQHIRNYMSTVETAVNSSTWMIEEHFTPDSLMAYSNRIVALNRHVYGCSITAEPNMFPEYGRYFSVYSVNENDSVITIREPEYEYFEKEWYSVPFNSGHACWIDPFEDSVEGTIIPTATIVSYGKPLRRKDGKVVGVISADLSLRQLAKAIDNAELGYPNAYYMLLGGDGRYFIHPDTTRLFKKTIFSDIDTNQNSDIQALGREMTAGKQGSMHVHYNKKLFHVCYRQVPGTDMSLALVCPDNDILKNYHRQVYIIIVLILIGLVAIQWICYWVVQKRISPLNQFLNTSQRLAEGHYDELIPHTDREDSIGQLQNSFATMQESLNYHVGSLRLTTEETKKSNEELAQAMAQAEEGVRQKNLFIQNVSHQIRTPLNIMMGFADVLLGSLKSQEPLPDEEVANITDMMKHNTIALERMVHMMYDSSAAWAADKSLSYKGDQVLCNEVARASVLFTKMSYPDALIRMTSDLPDSFCIVTSHLYLYRMLRELLYNAAKYSDGKHITISLYQTEKTVRFVVEDVGPGMPEETRDLIFTPFTKVDDLSEGLGLGLSLSKAHAQRLGGDLILDTDYHEGCRFILELPK